MIFLTNGGIPVTLFSKMLTFRDGNKTFKLDGDLLETITVYDFNVDHSNQQDPKLIYDFGKEMKLDFKQKGRKSNRDKSIKKLFKSPAFMASGILTIFLTSDPHEFCKSLKRLLQEKHAGNISGIINEEIVVKVDKLLEYKCITKRQHKQILSKCNPL